MGGWTAGSVIYSNMASTASNRKEFIDSAIEWLRKYDFDGLDMDWEYPANRGGKPEDKTNFGLLCKVNEKMIVRVFDLKKKLQRTYMI
jgi:chitinase